MPQFLFRFPSADIRQYETSVKSPNRPAGGFVIYESKLGSCAYEGVATD